MSSSAPTEAPTPRRRDAAVTRRLLLDAARRRFATHGYAATTVRDITDEAGVNVALVNRYFTSKEGLFEACLTTTVADFEPPTDGTGPHAGLPALLAARLAGPHSQEHAHKLMLLLRTSGDERAEQIRLDILGSFSEALAAAAGYDRTALDDTTRLRAEILLCTLLGVALLRSATSLEPLSSAGVSQLSRPLEDIIASLLTP